MLAKTVEARAVPPKFDVSEAMYRKITLPGAVHPWRRRPDPAACARAGVRGGHRRRARDDPGGGHNPLGRYPGKVQRADHRLSRPPARHRRAGKRQAAVARKAQDARSISPRRSASATGGATSPSPANCASCTRISRSTGWRRTPSRVFWKQQRARASAQRTACQRDAAHRARIAASTTCIASRRSAAWTRC